MKGLKGKVAIVTGAGSGMGQATAVRLASEGMHVVAVDINPTGGNETVALAKTTDGTCRFVQCDVSDQSAVAAAVAVARESGPVWALVNCAAYSRKGPKVPPEELDLKDWQRSFDVDVIGTLRFCQAVFPDMKEHGGRIINFGSAEMDFPLPSTTTVASTKGLVRSLSRSLALDWGKYGITVNTVMPSAVTPPYEGWMRQNPGDERWVQEQTPLRRAGSPENDVAPLIAFYISEEAGWTTGATLSANGGRVA